MSLDALLHAEMIRSLEAFLDKRRPPERIRSEIDLSYRIEQQSVILYTIRPHFQLKDKWIESAFAKATWVKSRQLWKVFWMSGNLKWLAYEPKLTTPSFDDFLHEVDEDPRSCFWG